MSVDQKQNVVLKTAEEERAQLQALMDKRNLTDDKKASPQSSSSSESSEECTSSDSETEKQNQINRQQVTNKVNGHIFKYFCMFLFVDQLLMLSISVTVYSHPVQPLLP